MTFTKKRSLLTLFSIYFLFGSQSGSNSVSNDVYSVNRSEISEPFLDKSLEILLGNHYTLALLLEHEEPHIRHRYSRGISWLDHTDAWIQHYYQQSASETANIEMGWVQANPHCNTATPMQPFADCTFHRIVDQFKVANRNIGAENLVGDQLTNLDALTLLTISLFNAGLYHQAQGLTTFLTASIIPYFASALDNNDKNLALQIEKSKLTCFVIQFEVMRERNFFHELNAIAVHLLYQSLVLEEFNNGHYYSQIYRLRYALAIPSMPMLTAASMILRTNILTSLQHLSRYFNETTASLSTEDFVKEVVSATPFHMAHQGLNDRGFQLELGNTFLALCPGLAHTAEDIHPQLPSLLDHSVGQKDVALKLGFVSAHFFSHSIGRVMIDTLLEISRLNANLTRKHDHYNYTKTNVTFEVYLYFIDLSMKDDQSGRNDEVTQQYKSIFGNRFLRVQSGNLSYLQQTIINDHIDFLMYTDLGMEINSYLLSFSRLAPIQAMWWGHPITSGLSSIDYFFGLEAEVSNAAWEQYSEQLVRFEFVNTIPFMPDRWQENKVEVANAKGLLPGLGLPQDAILVSVLGRLFKIHPDFIKLLAALLLEVHTLDKKNRVFLVFFAERTFDFNQLLIEALSEAVIQLSSNISETTAIMRSVKLFQFGRFYHQLLPITRIVLDTYPYGGCISSHDAFYHAVPIISLPSELIRGRFTLALYQQMNITSSIVPSKTTESFVNTTLPFIFDDQFYQEQRNLLREQLQTSFRRNKEVAKEWSEFIIRLFL